LTDHIFVLEAEVLDGADDVWVLRAAGKAIGSFGAFPCVCVLDEAEARQSDQKDCDEAFHGFGSWCSVTVNRWKSCKRKLIGDRSMQL